MIQEGGSLLLVFSRSTLEGMTYPVGIPKDHPEVVRNRNHMPDASGMEQYTQELDRQHGRPWGLLQLDHRSGRPWDLYVSSQGGRSSLLWSAWVGIYQMAIEAWHEVADHTQLEGVHNQKHNRSPLK